VCPDLEGIELEKQNDLAAIPDLLARLEPGFLPPDVFDAIARLVVLPTYVVVPLFLRQGALRVLLTRRDPDDAHYAGLLHPPGKIMLATDTGTAAVYRRLMNSELPNISPLSAPVFVEAFFTLILRGRELAMVHFLEIADPGPDGESFDAGALPVDVIDTDLPRVIRAVEAFRNRGGS
jgi:hypothetical protein